MRGPTALQSDGERPRSRHVHSDASGALAEPLCAVPWRRCRPKRVAFFSLLKDPWRQLAPTASSVPAAACRWECGSTQLAQQALRACIIHLQRRDDRAADVSLAVQALSTVFPVDVLTGVDAGVPKTNTMRRVQLLRNGHLLTCVFGAQSRLAGNKNLTDHTTHRHHAFIAAVDLVSGAHRPPSKTSACATSPMWARCSMMRSMIVTYSR
jgi:hypothetical protein